jgi:hypothetical protein
MLVYSWGQKCRGESLNIKIKTQPLPSGKCIVIINTPDDEPVEIICDNNAVALLAAAEVRTLAASTEF